MACLLKNSLCCSGRTDSTVHIKKSIWASCGNAEPLQVQPRLHPIRKHVQEADADPFPHRNILSSKLFICKWSLLGPVAVSSGIFLSFSLDLRGEGLGCSCLFAGVLCHRCTLILLWIVWLSKLVISACVHAPPHSPSSRFSQPFLYI